MGIREKIAQHRADTNDGVTQICPGWTYHTDPLIRIGARVINGVIWRKPVRWIDYFPKPHGQSITEKLNTNLDKAAIAGSRLADLVELPFTILRLRGTVYESAASSSIRINCQWPCGTG